jgi:AcrR family transcriptional regulator
MPTRKPRRSRYNVQTPNRILDAAAGLFAERGYAGVALKDVAQAARVNGASVNYHFGDKRSLYRQVIERHLSNRERAVPLAEGTAPNMSAPQRLRAFIHSLMVQLLDDRVPSLMSRLMLREAIEPTAAFARAVDELPRRQLSILDGIIGEILGRPVRRTALRRMSLSVLGQCVYYRYGEKILRRTDPGLRYGKRTVEAIAEHIYQFSLSAIRGMKLHDRA